jgi:diacylglycerol kinase family enzyme
LENVRAEDGWLNILIHKDVPKTSLIRIFKKGEGKDSIFPVKHAVLGSSKEATALVDGYKSFKLPLDLQIIPKSLKIVVGKNRKVLLS